MASDLDDSYKSVEAKLKRNSMTKSNSVTGNSLNNTKMATNKIDDFNMWCHDNDKHCAPNDGTFFPEEGRRRSKSLGALDHDFNQYVSDSEIDEDDGIPIKIKDRKYSWTQPEFFKNMDGELTKLHGEDEEKGSTDKDDDRQDVAETLFDQPRRIRPSLRRSAFASSVGSGTNHSQWKPLSDSFCEVEEENDMSEDEEIDKDNAGQGGLGGIWNKLTKGHVEVKPQPQEPKQIDGVKYFRKGKKRAEKCQFLEAVALFNFALIRQREELGKNHIDCGRTLNEIGLCWLMLGERYPAMAAFEEALYILQKRLGDGAEEVAEVTNNIWMVLHEQREESMAG